MIRAIKDHLKKRIWRKVDYCRQKGKVDRLTRSVAFLSRPLDGPKACFNYTMASIATTDRLIARSPEIAAAAVRAIAKTQAALKDDVSLATGVGRKLFPPQEAELIAELIRRDLPYYDAKITPEFVAGMNAFARSMGILSGDVPCERVVATQFAEYWRSTTA